MKYYLSGEQAKAIDEYTSSTVGVPGIVLMERAALGLADVIAGEFSGALNIGGGTGRGSLKALAVVGGGNNGGDAVAAVRILKTRGFDACVLEVNPLGKKTDSFVLQERIAENSGVRFLWEKSGEKAQGQLSEQELTEMMSGYDVIVDGIFGVGLRRDVEGAYKSAVDAINSLKGAADRPLVVGCDIPSGIDPETGLVLGCAVRCDITVTFEYVKRGMLINAGREKSGRIICKEIGLFMPKTVEEAKSLFPGVTAFEFDIYDLGSKLPDSKPDSNKGTNGKVLIVAGSADVYGALYLCASACYGVGAGLVKVVTHEVNRNLLMDKLPEAMVLTYGDNVGSEDFLQKFTGSIAWADVILVGPGLGRSRESCELLGILLKNLREGQRLVIDADAINILSEPEKNGSGEFFVREFLTKKEERPASLSIVLTPHVGETVRLMKGLGRDTDPSKIKANPVEAAQWVSEKTGAVCVLKDARTVVSDPGDDRVVYINTTGNSGMSKGGSGDVLAGIVAGILARTARKHGNESASDAAGKSHPGITEPTGESSPGITEPTGETGESSPGITEPTGESSPGITEPTGETGESHPGISEPIGVNDKNPDSVFETVCAAVNIHGRAGDRARDNVGETGMLAGHVLDELRKLR